MKHAADRLYNQNKTIVVQGTPFAISLPQYRAMEYFLESEAIEPTDTHIVNAFPSEVWQRMVGILESASYAFLPLPSTINSNDPRNFIGGLLHSLFTRMSTSDLNEVYRAAHFMKVTDLKRAISLYFACRVYMRPTMAEFQSASRRLEIKTRLTGEKVREYQERFPFIN